MSEADVYRARLPIEATWYFDGWSHNHKLQVSLSLEIRHGKRSRNQDNLFGLGINFGRSFIDDNIRLTYLENTDVAINKGLIWLPGGNGILAELFRRDRYHLMTIHTPLILSDLVFVSFSKLPYEITGKYSQSTFNRQKDASW